MGDSLTGWFPIPSGVKQGNVLSPSLFSLFINNLAFEIKHLNLDEYLQTMLNVLQNWCCRWRLTINQAKTQIMHFRKKCFPRSTRVMSLGSFNVEYTSQYKYLGFTFDEFMNLEFGIKMLARVKAVGAKYKTHA
uniref:Uncharacterized protein n=1 Tax=Sphaeramia orbicularis TaxID=375764 RepID=A0A672YNE9_9TELE